MLTLQSISKQFSSTHACNNITLTIETGEFFSLLGPSGCGKTTLLKIISGHLDADSGSLTLDGESLDRVPAHKRNVNTVFQNYALFPHLNVFDNVAFGLKMKGIGSDEIQQRVDEMLALVELDGFGNRKPSQLSGGQQQRVALARALVNRPQLLLLDEPLAALDVKLRKQMQLELRHLQKQLGMTFIYVTHDQEEALRMSDRIAVMNAGKVEQVGTPEEIYNHPCTRFVAGFIGETNFFESERLSVRDNSVEMMISADETIGCTNLNGVTPNGHLTLAVRPEKIRIHTNGFIPSSSDNFLRARIQEIVYLGTMHHIVAQVGNGQQVKVLQQTDDDKPLCNVGDSVGLVWNTDNTIVIAD